MELQNIWEGDSPIQEITFLDIYFGFKISRILLKILFYYHVINKCITKTLGLKINMLDLYLALRKFKRKYKKKKK